MLLLLAALLSCALAQSSTGTTLINLTASIIPLTINQNPGLITPQPADESSFLFLTGVSGSTYLRRTIDVLSNGEPVQTRLSHENSVQGGGVNTAVLSPDDSYVVFSSAKDQTNSFQHYTVGVGGGAITRITPLNFHPSFTTGAIPWQFVPCQSGGSRSDLFWATFRTALRTSPTDGALEIWRNTRSGDARRISIALSQQQDGTAALKVLTVIPNQVFYDYIFYTANPGPDNSNPNEQTGNAPRNVYMADWSGNNWQLNALPTVALGNSSDVALVRSRPGCGASGPGRYVQVADPITVVNIPSIYVYDVNNKARVGAATVSPAGAGPCSTGTWTPDESGVTFTCQVTPATATPADSNVDLYFFKTVGTTTATKISLAYPTVNVGAAVQSLSIQGDYLVWMQVTAAPALRSIVSYNWKTGGASTALFTETANVTFANPMVVQFADVESSSFTEAGAGDVGPGTTPSVWFTVTDSTGVPAKTSLYRAALSGAAGSAAQIADTLAVSSVEARRCGGSACSGGANTDTCRAANRGCQSGSCCNKRCSGWVTFLGRTVASPQWQIYSVAHSGGAPVVTALTTTECTAGSPVVPIIYQRTVGHPFTNPLRPMVYFTQTTGLTGSEVQSFHAVQAGSATLINFAPNPVARGFVVLGGSPLCVAFSGTHSNPEVSPNLRWILYQSQTVTNGLATPPKPVAETFLAIADGSVAPRKVGPTLDADHTGGTNFANGIQWTRDSAFAIFGVLDQTTNFVVNRRRDQLWSVEASSDTVPKTYNLTTISNVALVNSVNDMSTPQFHPCNHRRLVFTTNLPENGSPRQIYSVLVTGGNTVRLSFDPNSGVVPAGFSLLNTREAVGWSANYFSATNADIFLNRASASMLAPMIALLALMLAFLH